MAIDVAEAVARSAGDLAERRRLRGFDALHFASHLVVADEFPDEKVRFSSADQAVGRAAQRTRRRARPGPARRR